MGKKTSPKRKPNLTGPDGKIPGAELDEIAAAAWAFWDAWDNEPTTVERRTDSIGREWVIHVEIVPMIFLRLNIGVMGQRIPQAALDPAADPDPVRDAVGRLDQLEPPEAA
jgi:hypothetical protein